MKYFNLKSVLVGLLFSFASSTAWAIDFDVTIKNLDGTAITDDKNQPVNLTIRTVCINALMAPMKPEDQNKPDSGVEKKKRDELARHILNAPHTADPKESGSAIDAKKSTDDHYVFTAEDIVLMKKLVNDQYNSPLVVAQTWAELEKK
jgi:hypothetical protein